MAQFNSILTLLLFMGIFGKIISKKASHDTLVKILLEESYGKSQDEVVSLNKVFWLKKVIYWFRRE